MKIKSLNRKLSKLVLGGGAGAGLLVASGAQGAVVSSVLNERIDPDDPNTNIGNKQSSSQEDAVSLNLDGLGAADVIVRGRTTFEKDKHGTIKAGSSLQLTATQAGTAIQLAEDTADGDWGEQPFAEDFGLNENIGPGQGFYNLPKRWAPDDGIDGASDLRYRKTMLLFQTYDDDSFPSRSGESAALSLLYDEIEGDDNADVIAGAVFVGFRLDAGEGSHRYGFLQFEDIDNDVWTAYGEPYEKTLESAATLVGFALESQINTSITTFDLNAPIPEPAALTLLGLGGLCLLPRRDKGLSQRRSSIA